MKPGALDNILGMIEPDLDPNSALNELDKGLRSPKPGEQCEAIVRFPALFEKYPFPIIINSAFLKLGDIFRNGTNFLRLWVLRVFQQSERHLDKISNIDEFIKKIFTVTHSNDPIARALCLRTLGSLSSIIPERKAVHHTVRVALDSHDIVEVSAAIYAASCFAHKSKTFGTTMCTKISSMVQKLSTPLDLKLRLIPIFKHMHHDIGTTSTVRKLCLELLASYPSENFVIKILETLTQLAVATITDISEQVTFLLKHIDDKRINVKFSVLNDLKLLADRGGHLWNKTQISILIISFIKNNESNIIDKDIKIVYITLDVLKSLASTSAIFAYLESDEASFYTLLKICSESTDSKIILKSIQIGTGLYLHFNTKQNVPQQEKIMLTMESAIESMLLKCCSRTEDNSKELELTLYNGCLLSKHHLSFCKWFTGILSNLILCDDIEAKKRNLFCQALGSIGSYSYLNIIKVIPNLIEVLKRLEHNELDVDESTRTIIITTILQAYQRNTIDESMLEFLKTIIDKSNLWVSYRIARNSFRYGQPELASHALNGLSSKVSTENYHFWISALHSIAKAESILPKTNEGVLQSRILTASNFYLQSISFLKAASCPSTTLEFQIEFARLRSEMLISFKSFFLSCGNLQFSPPPAISPSIFCGGNKDPLLACGRIVTQLRKSVREFYAIGDGYYRLYQTAFDADPESLSTVQVLQSMSLLIGRAIEKLVVSKDQASSGIGDQSFLFCIETDPDRATNSLSIIESCKRVVDIVKKLETLPEKVILQPHIECLKEAFRVLIETPIPYPRFFFQTLQSTRIKIAVSPQPRMPGESISIVLGNNLALKVEGIIDQSFSGVKLDESNLAHENYFRRPKSIRITVISTPVITQKSHNHLADFSKPNLETIMISKEAVPHRDFFTIQFLLGIWTPGVTNLSFETSIIDSEGLQWITGPKTTLSVKVLEEPSKSQSHSSTTTRTSQSSNFQSNSAYSSSVSKKYP